MLVGVETPVPLIDPLAGIINVLVLELTRNVVVPVALTVAVVVPSEKVTPGVVIVKVAVEDPCGGAVVLRAKFTSAPG